MGVWALTQGDLDQVYGVLMGGVCVGTDPGGDLDRVPGL